MEITKSKEEIVEVFTAFLDEKSLYWDFIDWLKERNESPEDLGLEDD